MSSRVPRLLRLVWASLLLTMGTGALYAKGDLLAGQVEEPLYKPTFNYDFAEFIHWLNDSRKERNIPGAALAIVSSDGIMQMHTWGEKEVGSNDPINPTAVFRIASMSKTFAGAATAMLVEEQQESWDTLLTDLFPGMQLGTSSSSKTITLKHVISHSTGLMPHSYSNMLDHGVDYGRIKRKFKEIPTVCSPGECYGYQNVVFSLVGDVIEQQSGDTYAHYIEEKLFKPLGMVHASVGLEAYNNASNATKPHRKVRDGRWRTTSTNAAYYSTAPASGINASVYDMTLWLRANLGAFPEVLPPELLAEMHSPVIDTPYGNYFNRWSGLEKAYYGIGWRVMDFRGVRVIHHGGGVRGYRSEMVFVPSADIGMVLLFNAESNLANDVVPTFLDNLLIRATH